MSRVGRPRILIADDHASIAEACVRLLENEFDVVGTVADGQALLEAVPTLEPDVVILDVSMPLLNGIEAGKQINKMMPLVRIVYLTMNTDLGMAEEAFRGGASGYLLKTSAGSELVVAVREVLNGREYISPLVTDGTQAFLLAIRVSRSVGEKLTNRPAAVVPELAAEGKSKEVA